MPAAASGFTFHKLSARIASVGTTEDWQRLATYVTRRRRKLRMTQADVDAQGGPSTATLRQIEGGERDNYRATVLARLERVLGWTAGSVQAILTGDEPTQVDNPEPAVPVGAKGPAEDAERLILDSPLPNTEKLRWIARLHAEREDFERGRAQRTRELIEMWETQKGA
jgi:hypothetical protein